jgi:hypothetical protein
VNASIPRIRDRTSGLGDGRTSSLVA